MNSEQPDSATYKYSMSAAARKTVFRLIFAYLSTEMDLLLIRYYKKIIIRAWNHELLHSYP